MPGEHITQEQADEYAIGGLEPRLERIVALHLAECPACRDIARDSERLASSLALGAPSRRASRKLKRRVWTAAGIARPSPIQRTMRVAPAAAAIAAVVVAAAAFTGMVSIRGQVNDLRAENTNLKTEINDALSQKVEIAVLQERLSDEEAASAQLREAARGDRDLLLAMLSPESNTAGVTATEGNDPAIGRLIWDENQKRVWFVANRLPSRPRGETYHIWVNADGKYFSIGTFNTDSTGFARYETTIPEGITSYDAFVVTIESSGAEQRQGNAVFVAVLSKLKN